MSEERLENPVTGESMRVLESSPERFRVQYALRPRGEIAGAHFHPYGEQTVSVVSGELHVRIAGAHRVIRAGESATIPTGAPHFQWNPGDVEAIVVEEMHPAARLHEFFRVLFRLAQSGRTDARGFPPLLLSAALFAEFSDTIRLAAPGTRLLLTLLAPLAVALGYRREIEECRRGQAAS
ncbi:cupin domain-containing protein [bacterium]|nr:cupin domain-containing protein [bacterium]